MGGKQKRAAKLRRWKEYQNTISRQQSKESLASEQSDEFEGPTGTGGNNGSEDHLTENDLYKIRMEILRQRQKKSRRSKHGYSHKWIINMSNRFCKAFVHWSKWPIVIIVSLLSFIGVFFLLRNLLQLFLPHNALGIDRTPAYTSLKNIAPVPIYKAVVLIDYLLTSTSLSWSHVNHIIYPPDEIYAAKYGGGGKFS